jgi:hypothetical protein
MKSTIAAAGCLGAFACGVCVAKRWDNGALLLLASDVFCIASLCLTLATPRHIRRCGGG